jgi:hypothetical protein
LKDGNVAPFGKRRRAVCEKCVQLDSKIEHYRLLASRVTDHPLLEAIKELIERMQAQQLALHTEQGK